MVPAIMAQAKRRILFLITTADWGGAQHFVLQIAKDAYTSGMEVLIAAGGSGGLEEQAQTAQIPFQTLHSIVREISPLRDIQGLKEIQRLIRTYQPDVVHLNSSKMSVLGSIAASREHVSKVVYRIGGWAFLENINPFKKWIYRVSEQWTASKKDIIVTLHPNDERIAKKLHINPREQLITIPNGIDLERFDRSLLSREQARAQLQLAPKEVAVGTIANFYGPKNILGYLDTIEQLKHLPTSIRFVIVGDGPEHAAIMQRCRELNLTTRIHFTGRRNDASSLLNGFDLFVLPSSKEGMPWALLEAMAAGLPCIATDVGACGWMLEPHGGLVVPVGDAPTLAQTIEQLLNDTKKREALGAEARALVKARFRWEEASRQTLELFR